FLHRCCPEYLLWMITFSEPFTFKVNRKVRRLALRSALSVRAGEDRIMVLEDFTFIPRTKIRC
ncbi:MAG: 50S ribosomal protein L4, partial [Calditrichaeota bacterium]|nr:50S ribosomal protein L4 [Calditrichota bacterium]